MFYADGVRGTVIARALMFSMIAVSWAMVSVAMWLGVNSIGRVQTEREAVRAVPSGVAIVFGAGLEPDGTPKPMLYDRVAAAADLYKRGVINHMLLSGDNSSATYDEPTTMRRTAIQLGVQARDITLDFAGFSTYETCVRAKEIFGVRSALLISQNFHIRRAVAICNSVGVDSNGLGVGTENYDIAKVGSLTMRDLAASATTMWEVLSNAEPKFLGEEVGPDAALPR